jgi:hypothetical protein
MDGEPITFGNSKFMVPKGQPKYPALIWPHNFAKVLGLGIQKFIRVFQSQVLRINCGDLEPLQVSRDNGVNMIPPANQPSIRVVHATF